MKLEPKYQLELWNGAVLRHRFSTNVAHIHTKQSLTNAVGTFNFLLPTKFSEGYRYHDISLYDKVKIWLGYEGDSFAGDPLFVGRVSEISTPLSSSQGYLRQFNGKDQGEILLRRLKGTKSWSSIAPHTIATEIATDLGLGTGEIDTDTATMPISVEIDPDRYETYFNLLRTISDHWYDGSNQVKKDWYIDVNNNLVWKARPLRTVGVETLTVGLNIDSYTVLRTLEPVRKKIHVYGAPEKMYPANGNDWSESLTPADGAWSTGTAVTTLALDSVVYVVPANSIKLTQDVNQLYATAIFTLNNSINMNYYPSFNVQLRFMLGWSDILGGWHAWRYVVIFLEDTSTKTASQVLTPVSDKVQEFVLYTKMGSKKNLGGWQVTSGFDWSAIKKVTLQFFQTNPGTGSGNLSVWIDNMYFNTRNFLSSAEDLSVPDYGLPEEAIVDEELRDDTECNRRANTLLYQLKDPPIRVDLVTKGNTNILMGDRLPLTIPAENITATNFDVLTVEHDFAAQPQGFKTSATLLNSGNRRVLPPRTKDELLVQKLDVIQGSAENKQFWNKAIRRG